MGRTMLASFAVKTAELRTREAGLKLSTISQFDDGIGTL